MQLLVPGMFLKNKQATVVVGRQGEELAQEYLLRLGYRIVARNYRRPFGEIDIIAQDGETVVFVEVKSRHSTAFGSPLEAVDGRKQRQLSRVAQEYLHRHHLGDSTARFDVIAVRIHRDSRPATIEHIQNAFDFAL